MVARATKRKTSPACLSVLLSLVVLAAVAPVAALTIPTSTDDFATASTSIYPETRDRVSSTLPSTRDQLSSALSQDLRTGYEQSCGVEVVESLAAPGRGAAARHTAWAGDVNAINKTVNRLGQRALRESGGDWVRSEALFNRYLGGVQGRLQKTGAQFGIEWQPAAIPGRGRVRAFRSFVDRSGTRRVFATKGSRRLDAGLVDLTQPGRFRPLVSGYDITLNARKSPIVGYYQEAFGDIPILDIRISGR